MDVDWTALALGTPKAWADFPAAEPRSPPAPSETTLWEFDTVGTHPPG